MASGRSDQSRCQLHSTLYCCLKILWVLCLLSVSLDTTEEHSFRELIPVSWTDKVLICGVLWDWLLSIKRSSSLSQSSWIAFQPSMFKALWYLFWKIKDWRFCSHEQSHQSFFSYTPELFKTAWSPKRQSRPFKVWDCQTNCYSCRPSHSSCRLRIPPTKTNLPKKQKDGTR